MIYLYYGCSFMSWIFVDDVKFCLLVNVNWCWGCSMVLLVYFKGLKYGLVVWIEFWMYFFFKIVKYILYCVININLKYIS